MQIARGQIVQMYVTVTVDCDQIVSDLSTGSLGETDAESARFQPALGRLPCSMRLARSPGGQTVRYQPKLTADVFAVSGSAEFGSVSGFAAPAVGLFSPRLAESS